MADDHICIGDLVTFESDNGACLSVDICGGVVWSAPNPGAKIPPSFEQCVWRVCDKLSYSDQAVALMRTSGGSTSQMDTEVLRHNAEREKQRNAVELSRPSGKETRYGSVVQLQHVASGRFLGGLNTPAKLSRECLGLVLEDGSAAVYFQIAPRYKVRSEGGSVLSNDVILLAWHTSPGYFVHETVTNEAPAKPAAHTALGGMAAISEIGTPTTGSGRGGVASPTSSAPVTVREANMSRTALACGVTIAIYQRPSPGLDATHLHVSQCLRLFDRENDGFLVASCDESGYVKPGEASATMIPAAGAGAGLAENKNSGKSQATKLLEMPQLSALPVPGASPNSDAVFLADSLWTVEHATSSRRRSGGLVEWQKPQYRIKHTASGRFLTVSPNVVRRKNKARTPAPGAAAAPEGMSTPERNKSLSGSINLTPGLSPGMTPGAGLTVEEKLQEMTGQRARKTAAEEDDDEVSFRDVTLEKSASDSAGMARQVFAFDFADTRKGFIPTSDIFVVLTHVAPGGDVWYAHISGVGVGLVMSSISYSYDALLVVEVNEEQAAAVRFVRSVTPLLRKHCAAIEAGPGSDKFPKNSSDVEFTNRMLLRLMDALTVGRGGFEGDDELVLTNAADVAKFTECAVPCKLLQNCVRQQNLLSLLLRTVAAPMSVGLKMTYGVVDDDGGGSRKGGDTSSNAPSQRSALTARLMKKNKNDWVDKRFRPFGFTHQLLWAVVRQSVIANDECIMHLASVQPKSGTSAMQVILEQVPFPVGAANLLTTLVNDTKELLLKVVDEDTVRYFKRMISDFGPQARFLNFYAACVSCREEPIRRNQNIMLRELVTGLKSERDNILLTLYTLPGQEHDPFPAVDVGADGAYLGQEYFRGRKSRGFPRVYVAWEWADKWKVGAKQLYYSPTSLALQQQHIKVGDGDLATAATELGAPTPSPYQDHIAMLRMQDRHVPIEELCWVLNKTQYYHKARRGPKGALGPRWTDSEERKFGNRPTMDKDGHDMIGNYLYAQIELLAELVYGRNYEAIAVLEERFPFVMLVGLMSNTDLPYKIRGSFVKLTKRLWLDRYPSETNCGRRSLPDVVWSYTAIKDVSIDDSDAFPSFQLHEVNPLRQRKQPIYSIDGPGKYRLLTDFIRRFVLEFSRQVTDNVHQNICVGEVMGLTASLASFGFYPTAKLLAELIRTLLPMLDGRSDVQFNDDSVQDYVIHSGGGGDGSGGTSVVAQVERYVLTSQSSLVMQAKVSMLRTITVMVALRQQFRLHRMLFAFTQWVREQAATVDNAEQGGGGGVLAGLFTNSRHRHNSQHDHDKDAAEPASIRSIPQIFDVTDPRMNTLCIDHLSPIPYSATLIDLLMYQSDALFESALDCLVFVCVPMKSLMEVGDKVLMLADDKLPVFGSLDVFDCYVSQIKQEFESVEVWGRDPVSDDAAASFKNVWTILRLFKEFLEPATSYFAGAGAGSMSRSLSVSGKRSAANGNVKKSRRERDALRDRQQLFYDFDVHTVLLMPLRWAGAGPEMLAAKAAGRAEDCWGRSSLADVAVAGLSLLRSILLGNQSLRTPFQAYVPHLLPAAAASTAPFPNLHDASYLLLSEIYRGSAEQVASTPHELFPLFGSLLYDDNSGNNHIPLDFFLNQLMPMGSEREVIPRSQVLVARELTAVLDRTTHRSSNVFSLTQCHSDTDVANHIMGVNVVACCCRANADIAGSVGSAAVSFADAMARLHGMLDAVDVVFNLHYDDDGLDDMAEGPEGAETTGGENGEEPLVASGDPLPSDMGIGLVGVHGTPALFVAFLTAYLNLTDWVYMSTTAVDVRSLVDPAVHQLLAQLTTLLKCFCDKGCGDQVTSHASADGVKGVLASWIAEFCAEAVNQGLYSTILRWLTDYAATLSNCKDRRASAAKEWFEIIKEAAEALYPVDSEGVSALCAIMRVDVADVTGGRVAVPAILPAGSIDAGEERQPKSGFDMLNSAAGTLRSATGSSLGVLKSATDSSLGVLKSATETATDAMGHGIRKASVMFSPNSRPGSSSASAEMEPETGQRQASTSLGSKYRQFLRCVKASPMMQKRFADDEQTLLTVLLNAQSYTDPDNKEYVRKHQHHAHFHAHDGNAMRSFSGSGGSASGSKSALIKSEGTGMGNKVAPEESPVDVAASVLSDGSGRGKGSAQQVEQRTNKVLWSDIVTRMVAYVDSEVRRGGAHKATGTILRILMVYLKSGGDPNGYVDGRLANVDDELRELRTGETTEHYQARCKAERQNLLNSLGVSDLVYKLVVTYDNGDVFNGALELGSLLLQDGNLACQDVFAHLAKTTDADGQFFSHIYGVLLKAKAWVQEGQISLGTVDRAAAEEAGDSAASKHESVDDPLATVRPAMFAITFMTQLCEGHRLDMQNMLRDQSAANRFSSNLVFTCASFVDLIAPKYELYRHITRAQRVLLVAVLDFLIEACQGPCPENQLIIGSYGTLAACKIMLLASASGSRREAVLCVKCKVVALLAALLENVPASSPVTLGVVVKLDLPTLDSVYKDLHFALFALQQQEGAGGKTLTAFAEGEDWTAEEAEAGIEAGGDDGDELHLSATADDFTTGMCSILGVRKKVKLCKEADGRSRGSAEAGGEGGGDEDMPHCHQLFSRLLGKVEVRWNGKIEEVWFPMPADAKYLSNTTKKDFLDSCDLATSDTRKKDLMGRRNSFLDEMEVFSGFPGVFQFILRNYYELKYVLFVVVVLLNFSIILELTHGSKTLVQYYRTGISAQIMGVLGLFVFVGYGALMTYWLTQHTAFNLRKLRRAQAPLIAQRESEEEAKAAKKDGHLSGLVSKSAASDVSLAPVLTGVQAAYVEMLDAEAAAASDEKLVSIDYTMFAPLLGLSVVFVVACVIHFYALEETTPWSAIKLLYTYGYTGALIFGVLVLVLVRAAIVIPGNELQLWVCVAYDTLAEGNVFVHVMLVLCIGLALSGYVFLYSVVLLDYINMSSHAKNTVRSIAEPIVPLLNVGMIFLIVIEIFGIFSFVRLFGGEEMQSGVAVGDDDNIVECSTAWACLGIVFYGGLMNSDISSVLAQSSPGHVPPGEVSFTSRFFLDLVFFIIVGALLFNMVTGIIVDTFSALREESEEIERLKTTETFISGLTAEALDCSGVSFEDVQREQDLWNYVFYTIYLDRKDQTTYDGLEVYVANALSREDDSWMPHRTCAALEKQRVGAGDRAEGDEEGEGSGEGSDGGTAGGPSDAQVASMARRLGELQRIVEENLAASRRIMEMLDGRQ